MSDNMFIPNTPTPSGLDVDPEYVVKLESSLAEAKAKIERYEKALGKISKYFDGTSPEAKIAQSALRGEEE